MAEAWNVTLTDDTGAQHAAVLSDVVGSIEQPDWRGSLSIGSPATTGPRPDAVSGGVGEGPSPEMSLRMDEGPGEGRVARIQFTGATDTAAQVYGLSGFGDPPA